MPLSSTRQRERGFNQSLLLANKLSGHFHIPLSTNNLIRIRHTESQSLLNRKNRWTNIQGAFKINHPSIYQDQAVLLVDDLLTTGATASEASSLFKKAGAKTVGVLTLAIAHFE